MLYILNEKEYIRNILTSKIKPANLSMGYFITLIAKYYYSDAIDAETLSDIIKKKLAQFDLKNYQEYKYHNKIISICSDLFNDNTEKDFKEKESIPIYENEINFINTLKNDSQKKLMFTLFAVARYMDCDGWTNKKTAKDIAEVFKLANVTLSTDQRNKLLHELYLSGSISFGVKVNNLNIKVRLDDTGNIAYRLRNFSNIGYQYIGSFKKGYKLCADPDCGKPVKIKGSNCKYCKTCARQKELEKYAKYNMKREKIGQPLFTSSLNP